MKNLLSTAALIAMALPILEANPDATKVFATADGNIFLPDALNRARLHAKEMKLDVQTIDRATATASADVLEQIATDAEANVSKELTAANKTPVAPVEDTNKKVSIDAARGAQEDGAANAVTKAAKTAGKGATKTGVAKSAVKKPAAVKTTAEAAPKTDAPAAEGAANTEAPAAEDTTKAAE